MDTTIQHAAASSARAFVALVTLPSVALCACLTVLGCKSDDGTGPTPDAGPETAARLLDPVSIPKFAQPLLVPKVMPPTRIDGEVTEYEIAARQFRQQVLPPPMPQTTVWGYGRAGDPLPGDGVESTFSYPGPTVEVRSNHPVRVKWVNDLVDEQRRFLPHLLPIDQTLHWANPGGGSVDHEHDGVSHAPYTGPVPIVTHVHGAHSFDHSDGYPEAWYLPDATNIPAGFATRGPFYGSQADVGSGAAVFEYPLDERATTLWYHDHTIGMTRVNIYAGLAGFWIVRDEQEDALNLPGPAPRLDEAPGTRHYEIPLLIQDRSFAEDGSLYYPRSRAEADGYTGPYVPDGAISPIWNPEVFGNVMVVNGRAWPYFEVEPRLYRFRILNGADARTLILALDREGIDFVQIGSDGGLLPSVVPQTQLVIGPAERADVLVDFSGIEPGTTITMLNRGPDEPYDGPDANQTPADASSTGLVMQFRVVAGSGEPSTATIPTQLPPLEPLPPSDRVRDLLLFEQLQDPGGFSVHVQLGTVEHGPLFWNDPITEVIKLNDTETWRLVNTTEDGHPIHIHLIDFRVLDRTPFDVEAFKAAETAWLAGQGPQPSPDAFVTGPAVPAPPAESGWKDTVLALPGMITRLQARFDRAGRYVWHCHIIEHEDNDMMRPLEIVP